MQIKYFSILFLYLLKELFNIDVLYFNLSSFELLILFFIFWIWVFIYLKFVKEKL